MTVKQLIKQLSKMDQNRIVVVSMDPEGNGFSTVEAINDGMRFQDGEIGYEKITPTMKTQGYTEDDIY